jgi:polyhydroxyalkanoate synthesis regulator phasin
VLDDLRNYLQMASGLTEATTTKAKDVVTRLLAQGISLSTRAIPAPEMMGQVQELADDLVSTSRNNREMLVGMIRSEVDRAVGRMGFVREDELAALRRHVQRLEKQIADLRPAPAGRADSEAGTVPSPGDFASDPGGSGLIDSAAPADDRPRKKKKVVVEDDGGHA